MAGFRSDDWSRRRGSRIGHFVRRRIFSISDLSQVTSPPLRICRMMDSPSDPMAFDRQRPARGQHDDLGLGRGRGAEQGERHPRKEILSCWMSWARRRSYQSSAALSRNTADEVSGEHGLPGPRAVYYRLLGLDERVVDPDAQLARIGSTWLEGLVELDRHLGHIPVPNCAAVDRKDDQGLLP